MGLSASAAKNSKPSSSRQRFAACRQLPSNIGWNREKSMPVQSGMLLLFGSGETAPGSRSIWATLFTRLGRPARVAILETPAGFEPNSHHVARRVADYLQHRLGNHIADIQIVPARQQESTQARAAPPTLSATWRGRSSGKRYWRRTHAARHWWLPVPLLLP